MMTDKIAVLHVTLGLAQARPNDVHAQIHFLILYVLSTAHWYMVRKVSNY